MKSGAAVLAIVWIVCAAIVALAPAWVSPVGAAERNRASALSTVEVELSEVRTRAGVERTVGKWRLKIDRFTDSAADATVAGFEKMKVKLDSAWKGVELERLRAATRDEWNGAQTSFDDDELKRVWQEVAG